MENKTHGQMLFESVDEAFTAIMGTPLENNKWADLPADEQALYHGAARLYNIKLAANGVEFRAKQQWEDDGGRSI
jgi:hypothetical protein